MWDEKYCLLHLRFDFRTNACEPPEYLDLGLMEMIVVSDNQPDLVKRGSLVHKGSYMCSVWGKVRRQRLL